MKTRPTIIIDTREKQPLEIFGIPVKRACLKFGDYSLQGATSIIAIERKSIADLYGSMLSGRLEEQLARLGKLEYGTLLVEGPAIGLVRAASSPIIGRGCNGYAFLREVLGLVLITKVKVLFAHDKSDAVLLVKNYLLAYHQLKNK